MSTGKTTMKPTRTHWASPHPSLTQENETGFALGQRVLHPKFGTGTVLNIEGQGSQSRIQVNFESEGSKWLVLAYARLEAA